MKKIVLFAILILTWFSVLGQTTDSLSFTYNYSLKELSELTVTTGSIQQEQGKSAPSNVTIITAQMIEERGYKTLVDICQDIPGFDFMMYNDGGGEYPTFNMNRGLGDVGNPEILIMVDGIVQNNISFNWSTLWTNESMFIDIDQIEIIQGPGSVMYGAQAVTGIIHLITKKNYKGMQVNTSYGSNKTQLIAMHAGTELANNLKLSLACQIYNSLGDMGDRYDPGKYFHNLVKPSVILSDYDKDGNYITNLPNPQEGRSIDDGFNTEQKSYAIRTKLNYRNNEIGFHISDNRYAYGSAIVAYEYDLSDKENTTHTQNYHIYANNQFEINERITLNSTIVYRATNIIPDGGFKYHYQFPYIRKSYSNYSYQGYFEEKLIYNQNENNTLEFGLKASMSKASNRVVSLGDYTTNKYSTNSSWDIASSGGGLNQSKVYPNYWIKELALYALWDHQFSNRLSSSFGLRYDYNSEFGSIINPRFAIDFNPHSLFGAKLIYGRAFRQPSNFELHNEFRGNPDLIPQNIQTTELELSSLSFKDRLAMKLNIYFSHLDNMIGKKADVTMPSGERFENIGSKNIGGISAVMHFQINPSVRAYTNYNFITGIASDTHFYQIDRTARHKLNAGLNFKFFNNKLISDLRGNYVAKRKAPFSNVWLHTYENGYAPAYFKANLTVSYHLTNSLMAQLSVANVTNESYYGIGRESGSGFIDDYDPYTNVNPEGLIPAYHPQPYRSFMLNLIYKIH